MSVDSPHLLAVHMRMSRQPDARDDESMSEVANLLRDAISIRDSLLDDQVSPATLSLKPEAAGKLGKPKEQVDQGLRSLLAERPADSGTLSMTRTSLRWPLLPKELRSKLHNQLVKLYESKKKRAKLRGRSKRKTVKGLSS